MRNTTRWAIGFAALCTALATAGLGQEQPPSVPTFPTQAEAILGL